MRRSLLKLSLIVLCLCSSVGFLYSSAFSAQPKRAPSWEGVEWINLAPGKTSLDVKDLKGQIIYLSFFQKWWPGCHKYGFPALQEIASYYKNDPEVAVVTIQTTFEGFGINNFEVLADIAKQYNLFLLAIVAGPEDLRHYSTSMRLGEHHGL